MSLFVHKRGDGISRWPFNMRTFMIVGLLVVAASMTLAAPAPQQSQQQVAIVKLSSDINPDGSFTYEWESANGQRAEARGQQTGPESQVVQGSFSFVADDGQTYTVTYTADENGFQPQGAHIPTPPPIPDAILKSIEFNARNPEPEERQQQILQLQPQPQRPLRPLTPQRPVFG